LASFVWCGLLEAVEFFMQFVGRKVFHPRHCSVGLKLTVKICWMFCHCEEWWPNAAVVISVHLLYWCVL